LTLRQRTFSPISTEPTVSHAAYGGTPFGRAVSSPAGSSWSRFADCFLPGTGAGVADRAGLESLYRRFQQFSETTRKPRQNKGFCTFRLLPERSKTSRNAPFR